ncbi:phosphonate ABC transporter, permease protein PhnE [Ideonella sp. DXS29W]|uniref:Phosphonate ABC transporter, permease protein PhnE n=1 Tax=Ideonella lacteola TaxID=2984193 RepID=A0ABU9BN66_9BURK
MNPIAPPPARPSPLRGDPGRRPWGVALAAVAVLVIASFWTLDLQWAAFFSIDALQRLVSFATEFVPPATDPALVRRVASASLETLAMSACGTALALAGGLLLALPASLRADLAGLADAPASWALSRAAARLLLNGLRAVPELVWATLLLVAAGLGPFPGTLALALHTTGVLGRLFAEAIENAPTGPAQALRWRGTGPVAVFVAAQLPQIAPQLMSYTLYRWENNIRAAAVLGVVGAGGLGQMLSFHLGLFQTREASTVLIATVGLVLAVDALSWVTRRRWMR